MSKLTKSYTLNMYSLLYVNYTSIKLPRIDLEKETVLFLYSLSLSLLLSLLYTFRNGVLGERANAQRCM